MGFKSTVAQVLEAGTPNGRVRIDENGVTLYDAGGIDVGHWSTTDAQLDAPTIAGSVFASPDDFTPGQEDWLLVSTGTGMSCTVFPGYSWDFLDAGDPATPVPITTGGRALPRGLPAKPSPGGLAAPATSAAATTATAAELKDAGVGDYAFLAVAGRWYEVRYTARGQTDTANTTMDVVIRDGGNASPTGASPAIAATSLPLPIAAAAGATSLRIGDPVQFTAGEHRLAAFYRRTAGTGLVQLNQPAGGQRSLHVVDIGA